MYIAKLLIAQEKYEEASVLMELAAIGARIILKNSDPIITKYSLTLNDIYDNKLSNKEIYIIVTAWDSEKANLNLTVEAIRGLTRDCMEGTIERGIILGSGSAEKGEIKNTTAYLEAYEMGKKA